MIGKLAFKNISYKPLSTFLSIVLMSVSIGLISLMIHLQTMIEEHFDNSIQNVNLVMGAKGSPLQLILSAVYQMDAPTGNISYYEAKKWMKHKFIKKAVPLAYGDNYKGYKIVGTSAAYFDLYDVEIAKGELFNRNFEVVVGSQVAQELDLVLGDTFVGTHGSDENGEEHDALPYVVVGVLKTSNTVVDRLIVCNIASVWETHAEHGHEDEHEEHHHEVAPAEHDHEDEHEEHHHEPDAHSAHEKEEHVIEEKEITAVLLQVRSKMAYVSLPRLVAQKSNMQIASPAIETNRLFSLLGVGVETIVGIAYGVMFIGGLSIFVLLLNMIKEKRYEFALLRTLGASKFQLFGLVLLQSLLISLIGFLLGSLLSRFGLYYLISTEENVKLSISNIYSILWLKEGVLLVVSLLIATVAALLPAIKAYRMSISKTLAHA